jgi:hypothetical protein
MQARRLPTLSGAAVVVLVGVVVALLPSTPGSGDSGTTIAAYYNDHQARTAVAAFVIGLTAPLLVAFVSVLAAARRNDAERSVAERVLRGGGVLVAGTFLMTAALTFALADVPDKVSGSALQALNLLSNDMWTAWNPAVGVMMLGAAATLRGRAGSLHVFGIVAAVIGVALFIPFADFFALLATALWLIAVSVVLWRDAAEPRYAARAQTA